jgi:hypothetical protein
MTTYIQLSNAGILDPAISVTSNNPPKLGIRDSRACFNDLSTAIVLGCSGIAPLRNWHDVGGRAT